jgi:hypothetical protein
VERSALYRLTVREKRLSSKVLLTVTATDCETVGDSEHAAATVLLLLLLLVNSNWERLPCSPAGRGSTDLLIRDRAFGYSYLQKSC